MGKKNQWLIGECQIGFKNRLKKLLKRSKEKWKCWILKEVGKKQKSKEKLPDICIQCMSSATSN